MSGVGPVEPGEGTRARDLAEDGSPPLPRPRGRFGQWYDRHRRGALAAAAATALLAAGGSVYLTRPHAPAPAPAPAAPYPSQVTDVTYVEPVATPKGVRPRSFSFAVALSVESGPPVTVRSISQPYPGISLTSEPLAPFTARAGGARNVVITMHVTDCRKAPESAGLPFLDVTLRNTRAIEVHSYILGQRYAQNLSTALQGICKHPSR
ncbi:Tat pathway signal sequence domain protein [Streptomyces sp. NPDC101209]|uniref:Tat pathway signal sequence domain protein n=1 Tax=Streptomyces sp. NPDC101209 TaxID=3366129 RepID=UPI0037FAB579